MRTATVITLEEARARLRPASPQLVAYWPRVFVDLTAAAALWGCVCWLGMWGIG